MFIADFFLLHSDNGTNLTAGEKELQECLQRLNQESNGSTLKRKGIEWHFSPATVLYLCGAWERLIESVNQSFKVVLQNRTVTEEVFRSVLTGVEALVNRRPLTHMSVYPIDPEPITLFHFLLGRPNASGSIDVIDPTQSTRRNAGDRLVAQCWNRLVRKVLPVKIERPKWLKEQKNLEIGDLVLISDKDAGLGDWLTARIV